MNTNHISHQHIVENNFTLFKFCPQLLDQVGRLDPVQFSQSDLLKFAMQCVLFLLITFNNQCYNKVERMTIKLAVRACD